MAPAPTFITKREAAELLSVTVRQISRIIAAGDLTRYQVGPRSVRLDRDQVLSLIKVAPPVDRTPAPS